MTENQFQTKGRFTKKSVTIDAYRLPAAGEDVPDDFHEWCAQVGFSNFLSDRDEGLLIPTLGGEMRADPGDWIIKGVKGEFYPCKPDVFEATYEDADRAMRANTLATKPSMQHATFGNATQTQETTPYAVNPATSAKMEAWLKEGTLIDRVAEVLTQQENEILRLEKLVKEQSAPSQELTLFNPRRALEIFNTAQAGSSRDVGTLRGIMAVLSDWESRPDPHEWLAPSQEEKKLRRLLCVTYAGAHAYMDDGEASDARTVPIIDFMRDSADMIEEKFKQRALRAAPSQDAEDADRYRHLVANARLIPEHWGGRWSLVVESRSPKGAEKEHIDAAIDAARTKQEEP